MTAKNFHNNKANYANITQEHFARPKCSDFLEFPKARRAHEQHNKYFSFNQKHPVVRHNNFNNPMLKNRPLRKRLDDNTKLSVPDFDIKKKNDKLVASHPLVGHAVGSHPYLINNKEVDNYAVEIDSEPLKNNKIQVESEFYNQDELDRLEDKKELRKKLVYNVNNDRDVEENFPMTKARNKDLQIRDLERANTKNKSQSQIKPGFESLAPGGELGVNA